MEVKLFELRDSATFMPVMAAKINPTNVSEIWMLKRMGYSADSVRPLIVLWRLSGGEAGADPYYHGSRTMNTAHQHMIEHWDELESGQVIDVAFLLGETATPKISERLE